MADTKLTKAEYLIQQLNVVNAKRAAYLLIFGFIFYHFFLHFYFGNDSCKWLISDGRLKGEKEWQSYGCMIHKYSET